MKYNLQSIYFADNIDFTEKRMNKVSADAAENPVFTVIFTVYNDTSLLNSAINSCLRQSFSSWELLILDNSDANDFAWAMIENAVAYDGRIHGFKSDKNVGWAKGSAILLEHARGKYVTFLSADDCLNPEAFKRLYEVSEKEDPDVIFVGNAYANCRGINDIESLGVTLPDYRVYHEENRSKALVEIMKTVYYNSMFHYEKREFLKEYGMNFFEPYYGDCETMTYAIGKAYKIVTLDMIAYVLTMNTSQTAGHYISQNHLLITQWSSVKELFMREAYKDYDDICYVARRIFKNFVADIQPLCTARWRDEYMNSLEISLVNILRELEWILSMESVGELFLLMKKKGFDELVSNIANIKIFSVKEIEEIATDSWLYDLIMIVLWRRKLSDMEKLEHICRFLLKDENKWCIGIYMFEELVEKCTDEEINKYRDMLTEVLQKYEKSMQKLENPWLKELFG